MSTEFRQLRETTYRPPSQPILVEPMLPAEEQARMDIARALKLVIKSGEPNQIYCDLSHLFPTDISKAKGRKYPLASALSFPKLDQASPDRSPHSESGKLEKATFKELLDLTFFASTALNKPVELHKTNGTSSTVLSRVTPGTTLESRLEKMRAMQEQAISRLKGPNILRVYTLGSLGQEDLYASDVDVVVVVDRITESPWTPPLSDFFRFEAYIDRNETTCVNQHAPRNFLPSETVEVLDKSAERAGAPLHLIVLTKQLLASQCPIRDIAENKANLVHQNVAV